MNVKGYSSISFRSMIRIKNHFRDLFLLSGLILAVIQARAGDYLSGYIRVLPESPETGEYRIQLNLVTSYGTTGYLVPEELYFGDGSPAYSLSNLDPDTIIWYGNIIKFIYSIKHHYPGPGTYTVGCSKAFRYGLGDIINAPDNYWIPFYTETTFAIDPFIGNNQTPEIGNQYLFLVRKDKPLDYWIAVADPEKDSLSYSIKIPKKDKNTFIPHYRHPQSLDPVNGAVVSRLSLENMTGHLYWAQPDTPGNYNIAVDINEWRYVEAYNDWVKMSTTTYDFYFRILETTNHAPQILSAGDTVVLPGQDLILPFSLHDLENDTFSIRYAGSVFGLPVQKPLVSLADSVLYQGAVEGQFHWNPSTSDVRPYPYSFILEAEDRNPEILTAQRVTHIWITGVESDPDPPVHLAATSTHAGEMILAWENTGTPAAGYVIERANDHFPAFRRIAGLPANSTEYVDRNVIPGQSYRYRIKALGTMESRYSEELVVPGDLILATEPIIVLGALKIFPNPASTTLNIRLDQRMAGPIEIRIYDLTGKLVSAYNLPAPVLEEMIRIPVNHFKPGYYLLKLHYGEVSSTCRFLKF